MAIEFTDEQIELLYKNGFTDEDIQFTIDEDRKNGLKDEEIQKNILKAVNIDSSAKPQKKGIDLTPSGMYKNTIATLVSPIRAKLYGEDLKTAKEKAMANYENFKPAKGLGDFLFDLGVYSKIPTLKSGSAALNFAGNAALQGGVPGALESLKRGGNVAGGAGVGTGIAATLQSLPYAGKLLKKPVEYLGKKAVESLTSLKPATIEQLVKPNSQALDLTEGSAQQLLANTTERVRDAYNNLLSKRGEAVRDAASKLNDNASRVNADDLVQDIVSTFDQYGGDLVNPARNMAGGLEKELIDLVNSGKPVNEISDLLNKIDTENILQGKAYLTNISDDLLNQAKNQGYDLSDFVHDIDSSAIRHIRKNHGVFKTEDLRGQIPVNNTDFEALPRILDNPDSIDFVGKNGIGRDVIKYTKDMPDNITNYFEEIRKGQKTLSGDTLYKHKKGGRTAANAAFPTSKTIPTNNIITDNEEYFNSLSPNDLQKVKEQIGKMAKWGDETSRTYAEPITRQIYNKFNQRLSDLSPELAQANAEYAALRNFQNNEGLKRILKPGDNIDTASSVLRNYNSTITKGNAGRNIQELEDVLVKNGEEPFLNVIDDINAANDLLKNIETGRNWLGATTLAKGLAKPVLRAVRKANKNNVPQKIQNIKDAIAPIAKLLPSLGAKGAANMLYGGVEYNDYR